MRFTHDTTGIRSVERSVRGSAERLRVVEHAPTGPATISIDERYLQTDSAVGKIAGYREELPLRRSVTGATNPLDPKRAAPIDSLRSVEPIATGISP